MAGTRREKEHGNEDGLKCRQFFFAQGDAFWHAMAKTGFGTRDPRIISTLFVVAFIVTVSRPVSRCFMKMLVLYGGCYYSY